MKKWSDEEIAIIRQNASLKVKELVKMLPNRSAMSIKCKKHDLGFFFYKIQKPNPRKGIKNGVYKKCEVCQKEFYVEPASVKKRRYCSRKCFLVRLRENWHALHPTVGWSPRALVKKIGKCEVCGFSDERILMLHHKDGNHKNNEPTNLIILCPNHHLLAHNDVKNWQQLWSEWTGLLKKRFNEDVAKGEVF